MTKFKLLFILLLFLGCSYGYGQIFNVENFDHKSGLRTNSVRSLAEDNDGHIWIGTENNGLAFYDGNKFNFFNQYFGKNNLRIHDISISRNNVLNLSTSKHGLLKLNTNNTVESFNLLPSDNKEIYSATVHNNRTVIIDDSAIRLLDEGNTIAQLRLPKGKGFRVLSKYKSENLTIIFTSQGNFVVNDFNIERLENWLGTQSALANQYISTYVDNNKFFFLKKDGKKTLQAFVKEGKVNFFFIDSLKSKSQLTDGEFFQFSDNTVKYTYLISNRGNLFQFNGIELKKIKLNNTTLNEEFTSLIVDKNETIWVGTYTSGLYKISQSAFIPLRNSSPLGYSDLVFYAEYNGEYFCRRKTGNSAFIGEVNNPSEFTSTNLSFKSLEKFGEQIIFNTNNGVYTYKQKKITPLKINGINNIQCAYELKGNELWVFTETGNCYRVYLDGRIENLEFTINNPSDIITTAYIPFKDAYFFGSLSGNIIVQNKEKFTPDKFLKIENLSNTIIRSFTDKNNTFWICDAHNIYAFKKSGERLEILQEEWIMSNAIYDFLIDENGNLIVGCSDGIIYIELDDDSKPIKSTLFGSTEGYPVYEVNHNTFQKVDKEKYKFASIEGLYLLNVDLLALNLTPEKPIIEQVKTTNQVFRLNHNLNTLKVKEDEDLLIEYSVINPQNPVVYYSYRINDDKNGIWSPWSKENTHIISSTMGGGDYQLDIRASFNKQTSSPVTTINIHVEETLFKKEGFISILILILVLFNIAYIIRRRYFVAENVLIAKDVILHSRAAAILLLFGGAMIFIIFNTAPNVLSDLPKLPILTSIIGVSTMLLGLGVLLIKKFKNDPHTPTIIGYLLVLGYNILGAQLTGLHPFYIIGIILTLFVTPVVISKLSHVISVCVIVLSSSILVVYTVDQPVLFNHGFFVADILTALFLVLITTYVRKQALEKLIFSSGVINNEDFLVAAFKDSNEISFLNESFKNILPKQLETYIGKKITELSFIRVNKGNTFDALILEKYKDKSYFECSFTFDTGDLRFFQFTCKNFNNNLRVIIGQDITDKIELEHYYEVIVNNSQDLIYRLDVSGHFTFINQQCIKSLGLSPEEIIGKFYTDVIHSDWKEEVNDFYSHQFKNKIKNTYSEVPIVTATGKTIWLGQHMTAIFNESGDNRITGYLGLGRNITERRRKDAIINTQNKDIKDSINYAKRIQVNLLPEESKFAHLFKESFVYFKPKDIVSGDFYWLEKIENKTILVTADCTGHGVPGAFMTLLGINLLNQIILENKIFSAGEILNQLDNRLSAALKRNKTETINDGLECSICVFDDEKEELEFALAGSKFVVTTENGIKEIKGVSAHIGENASLEKPFESSYIPLDKKDSIYLFSDGIVDQFGGAKGKKLKRSRFTELIENVQHLSLEEQKKEIQLFMENWMIEQEQTDDICLIAVKRK